MADYNPWFVPVIVAVHLAIRYAIPAIVVAWVFGLGSPLWWLLSAIAAFDYLYACIRTWRHPEQSFRRRAQG